MEHTLAIDAGRSASAAARKTGLNCEAVLAAVIERVPPPTGDPERRRCRRWCSTRVYDEYRGAVTYVRVMNGTVRKGQKIKFLQAGHDARGDRAGPVHAAARRPRRALGRPGRLPHLQHQVAGQRPHRRHGDRRRRRAGRRRCPATKSRSGWCTAACIPSDGQDFEQLRDALDKLSINDPSFEFEPETSDALGFGFRCGFLGLLHMEIVQQRLEQESDIDLVQTAPNVTYEITTNSGEELEVHTPQKVPDQGEIEEFRQPIVRVNFVLPTEYIGPIMKLCTDRRGEYVRTEYLSPTRAMLTYDLALADVIYDMHDKLKSATRGYGTMDYELLGYRPADLVRLDILVNGDRDRRALDRLRPPRRRRPRPGRSSRSSSRKSRGTCSRCRCRRRSARRIIARETISAMRKNVTAKCYGGDITRKRKLWEKQKEGKKRMKSIGQVDIPQKAFLAVLETGEEEGKKK